MSESFEQPCREMVYNLLFEIKLVPTFCIRSLWYYEGDEFTFRIALVHTKWCEKEQI